MKIKSKLNKIQVVNALVLALAALGMDQEALAVSNCSKWVKCWGEKRCGDLRLYNLRCNHPLCPVCSKERTTVLRKRIRFYLEHVSTPCEFVTLTVVNVPSLSREYVDWLIGCFKRLRAGKFWGSRVLGGVYAIDTTYNDDAASPSFRTWHVHVHCIVTMIKPTEREKREHWWVAWLKGLKAEWFRVTGNSWVVNIVPKITRRCVFELIKYSAKGSTFFGSSRLVGECLAAFHHVRRIQTFGSFFDLDFEDLPPDWSCRCGSAKLFSDWVALGSVPLGECEEVGGQLRLRSPDLVWSLLHNDGESPAVPVFSPGAEQPALFYEQREMVFA